MTTNLRYNSKEENKRKVKLIYISSYGGYLHIANKHPSKDREKETKKTRRE